MRLRILVPAREVLDEEVGRIVAEGPDGSFGILPRHIDVAAVLAPGILLYEDRGGRERWVATDRGTLVKRGGEVSVSVRDAVVGEDLATLRAAVEDRFEAVDERERSTRAALAQLEARFIRRLLEHERRSSGA